MPSEKYLYPRPWDIWMKQNPTAHARKDPTKSVYPYMIKESDIPNVPFALMKTVMEEALSYPKLMEAGRDYNAQNEHAADAGAYLSSFESYINWKYTTDDMVDPSRCLFLFLRLLAEWPKEDLTIEKIMQEAIVLGRCEEK